MPINTNAGEFFPELGGAPYVVVPVTKWADTPMLDTAAKHAADKFVEAGALRPIKFMPDDVVVQEYHSIGKIIFLFQKMIAGKEWFVPYEFSITPDVARQLAVIGMWSSPSTSLLIAPSTDTVN